MASVRHVDMYGSGSGCDLRDRRLGLWDNAARGRPVGAVERHGARQVPGPIEAGPVEHDGDELGFLRAEHLGEAPPAHMRDQAAFPVDALAFVLCFALEKNLITLPFIAQVDHESFTTQKSR